MDKVLMAIMEQLNLIGVRGDDVERMAFARRNVMQLYNAIVKAKAEEEAKAQEQKTE